MTDGLGAGSSQGTLAQLEARQDDLRQADREALGVPGQSRPLQNLRKGIGVEGIGWYSLATLSLFMALDGASAAVLGIVGPDVSKSLGFSKHAFATLALQRQTFVGLSALLFAYLFYRQDGKRAFIAKQTGFLYGLSLCLGSVMTWYWGLTG